MSRRIVPLSPEHVALLESPCATCVAWEGAPAEVGRRGGPLEQAGQRAEHKRAWVATVLREWGPCGRVVLLDGVVVAHVLYAPAALVPGGARFATAPVSSDAVLMSTVVVEPAHTGHGLGRLLVQQTAADLVRRGEHRALEAFGARGPRSSGACTAPVDFLLRVGFTVQREHPVHPRLRLDLRATLTWREEIEAVLDRLRGAVRPSPAPQRRPGTACSDEGLRR